MPTPPQMASALVGIRIHCHKSAPLTLFSNTDFSKHKDAAETLQHPLLERAIGVIYRPETERESHYFSANVSKQFDAVFHFDETRAVEPLERTPAWEGDGVAEVDETYPSGL